MMTEGKKKKDLDELDATEHDTTRARVSITQDAAGFIYRYKGRVYAAK